MMRNWRRCLVLAAVLCWAAVPASAAVKLHGLFTDNVVLQQQIKVPIWGTADKDEQVTVKFQDQTVSTQAKGGKWMVCLNPLTAGGPSELVVSAENTICLKNVLVGEVWVASGQSNMWWTVNLSADPQKVVAASANPKLRLFTVPHRSSPKPEENLSGSWSECGPATVANFSAVAYHFGKHLQEKLGVPVGMINSSVGGTPAEAWTSREKLESHPLLKPILERKNGPTGLYNGMIACLQPFAIRGAIWYQGESNAGLAYEYRTLFPAMIACWRENWKQGDFPFLFVQLAPFMAIEKQPAESAWAELREAQLMTMLHVPHAAMAVITDVGDEKDIHPKQKQPVGERLALGALALAHGQKIEYSGPIYKCTEVRDGKAVLQFDHLGGGLLVKGDKLTGFTICGADRKFVNAEARVEGDTVVVSSPQVVKPSAVRFGWANYPVVNLWNKAGLPASPFRTDDFPGLTQPKK